MQCGDNRFEIIEKAKKHLINATNIKDSPEEMEVIDSILFRCWQMGWLDKYNNKPGEALEYLEHIKKDDFNMILTTYPPLPAYNGITKDEMFNKIEETLINAREDKRKLKIFKESYKEQNEMLENLEEQARERLQMLLIIKFKFGMDLYDICKRKLELCTCAADRNPIEKIIEFLKKEEE